MFWLSDYTCLEQLAIVAVIMFLTIILAEVVDCSKIFSCLDGGIQYKYGYEEHNGPVMWKMNYPNCKGQLQSPINICTDNVMVVVIPSETLWPLKFSAEYYNMPSSIIASNDGHGLVVYACWDNNRYPKVGGAFLEENYRLDCVRFRWGASDEEGSEHTIDSIRFGMEIQAMHIKVDKCYYDLAQAACNNSALAISYLFQVTPVDNPYLEPLLSVLKDLKSPNSYCLVEPFPISWLILPFTSKYFTYLGSLSFPPCSEGVDWIVQSEPLSISSRQLKKFRKLNSFDGQLVSNTRPVQELNGRSVYFYD